LNGITNTRLIKAGVRYSDSRVAGQLYQIKNEEGVLHDHHFQSTVTDLQTPVYSSAPMGIRKAVFRNINQPHLNWNYLFSPENDTLALTMCEFVGKRESKSIF
jgi:hypothetical protein